MFFLATSSLYSSDLGTVGTNLFLCSRIGVGYASDAGQYDLDMLTAWARLRLSLMSLLSHGRRASYSNTCRHSRTHTPALYFEILEFFEIIESLTRVTFGYTF